MSIAEEVRIHLKNKPYIREGIEKGIVNFSSLTRQIQKDLKIKNFEAIKAALRRLSEDMKKSKHNREERVLEILKQSKTTIHDGYSAIITDKSLIKDCLIEINTPNFSVHLVEKEMEEKTTGDILKKNKDCTIISIKSDKNIENVPGVVAYITSTLAEENINVLEFISSWTDTIIVVDKKDSIKTYEILNRILG